ncbi:MAG: ABC transporter permease [Candidatus Solibacter sp.]
MPDFSLEAFLQQFGLNLRLYFRNKMAMFYGYLFPAIFLAAFWVIYRYEPVPILRHMGQLLTVTILGGACLGMPTTMVSERERGVWRLYRLTPISTRRFVIGAVLVRFCIVITAGLLQFALAIWIGMPFPRHPAQLALAFGVVTFAFLGLGLVVAAAADNVPAVQALGQCIFLPMLIIGGVAVPLASLPDWALHVSLFFPGRYAVEALQACIAGNGLRGAAFDFVALLLIGAAGFLAGGWMFRWEPQQKFATHRKGWLVLVLAAWAAVGLIAETRGLVGMASPRAQNTATLPPASPAAGSTAPATPPERAVSQPEGVEARRAEAKPAETAPAWKLVTIADVLNHADFDALPPDAGIISPIARADLDPPGEVADQLLKIAAGLPAWPPAGVTDPVQRVRNLLYVAAVADVLEMEIVESYLPGIVFKRLQREFPKDDLTRLLYWVATHPSGGQDRAAKQLQSLGLGVPPDLAVVRERVTLYSWKLLGRQLGRLPK